MKHLLIVSLFALATSAGVIAEESVSNERISEMIIVNKPGDSDLEPDIMIHRDQFLEINNSQY